MVFGSVIQLQSEFDNPGTFLHSFNQWSPEGSRQQQVAGYSYPDLNTHWIVIRAAADNWEKEEIPSRIQYLKNGDILRLRHVPTRKCLHSHDLRSIGEPHNLQLCEVTGYGAAGFDGDGNDWWVVEVVDEAKQTKLPRRNKSKVKALESLIRLRHYSLGCHLVVQDKHLPDPWGEGRREVVCRKEASVNARSTWRITMNDHDNCKFLCGVGYIVLFIFIYNILIFFFWFLACPSAHGHRASVVPCNDLLEKVCADPQTDAQQSRHPCADEPTFSVEAFALADCPVHDPGLGWI